MQRSAIFVVLAAQACAHNVTPEANRLTEAEQSAGWQLLFDGQTAARWRGYLKPALPAGWEIVDGALTRTGSGGDIITRDQFENFELSLDWKIKKGGNSGILFKVIEDPAYTAVWHTGPEMQVLDNEAHRDGLDARTSAGSNYALHAPARDVTRPPGEWNHARIVVKGNHVEHWLNGEKLLAYEIGSTDWKARVQASKFNELPAYGTARAGHIALQDHGDWVAYRNIKIRPIS